MWGQLKQEDWSQAGGPQSVRGENEERGHGITLSHGIGSERLGSARRCIYVFHIQTWDCVHTWLGSFGASVTLRWKVTIHHNLTCLCARMQWQKSRLNSILGKLVTHCDQSVCHYWETFCWMQKKPVCKLNKPGPNTGHTVCDSKCWTTIPLYNTLHVFSCSF